MGRKKKKQMKPWCWYPLAVARISFPPVLIDFPKGMKASFWVVYKINNDVQRSSAFLDTYSYTWHSISSYYHRMSYYN